MGLQLTSETQPGPDSLHMGQSAHTPHYPNKTFGLIMGHKGINLLVQPIKERDLGVTHKGTCLQLWLHRVSGGLRQHARVIRVPAFGPDMNP